MRARIQAWLDERFPMGKVRDFLQHQARKALPAHTTWWHTLGSLLLYLTVSQIVTGVLLMVYYRPTPEAAFESVGYITTGANFGWLVRGLHAWGATVTIALLVAHMLRTFLMGTYKKPRELTWVIGVLIFGIVLMFSFTGYLLPWDQLSYWGTVIGTEITGALPAVGGAIKELVRGGEAVANETLGRFYVVHVAVLPWVLAGLVAFHLVLVRLFNLAPLTPVGDEKFDERRGVRFFPEHVARESIVFMVFLASLVALVFFAPPELGERANPLKTPEGIKPEWYFLPTYQLLKYFPKLLGLIISFVPMALLVLWPFLDRGRERHPRKRRWAVALGALALLAPLVLGVLGHVSERTFIVQGARIHFDILGRPSVVGEVLPPERRPQLAIATTVEEGKRMIVTTVTQGGEPVEGARVELVTRSERGRLVLGQDETIDDGTAAVPFPEKAEGDANGELTVTTTVTAPETIAGYSARARLPGAMPRTHEWWTRACPESAALLAAILAAGLFTALVFRRLAREPGV